MSPSRDIKFIKLNYIHLHKQAEQSMTCIEKGQQKVPFSACFSTDRGPKVYTRDVRNELLIVL